MRVEYNVGNDTIGSVWHVAGRDYLRDYRLTSLTGGEFVALLQIADYLDFDSDSCVILLVLELNYAFNESGFIIRV